MIGSAVQNPEVRAESKSAMKKRAKAEAAAAASAASTPAVPESGADTPETANGDGSYESPYLKELYKNIRNVNKKITRASVVDNVLEQNPGKSLDELIASRKINADQKAQVLKKPALKASLTQFEEQIAQYKKFDEEYKAHTKAEVKRVTDELTKKHNEELESKLQSAKQEAYDAAEKQLKQQLLVLSKFLRLAASRRQQEHDAEADENKALEGLLVEVYTGDETSVKAMFNLMNGAEELCVNINGEKLPVTYKQIKAEADAFNPPLFPEEEEQQPTELGQDDIPDQKEVSEYPVESDPTIANAGLTELDAVPTAVLAKTTEVEENPSSGFPQNSGFGDGANIAAEDNWNRQNDLSASQDEWVDVRYPRDAAETDTGFDATPAALTNTQSWADEQPDAPQSQPKVDAFATLDAQPKTDGFSEVQRTRGGQQRGGGGRGRGFGGSRGGRGNGEGGRGGRGPRGGRGGAPRGPRPQDT